MAITLPLPLRVAAGLLATGIDLVKSLPEDIPAIPVTLVGNAMRLSMKFQQEITSLATRGDELLSGVINAPLENPPWAKFDDDEPVRPAPTSPKHAKPNGPAGGGGGGGKSSARTTIDRAVDDQAGNDLAEGVRTTGPRAAPPKSDRTRTTRTKTDRAQPAGSQTVDTVVTAITEGAGKAETEASDALAAEATAAEAKPADAKPADAKPADPRDADPAGADSSVTTTDGTADTDHTDGNALKTPVASAVAPADTTAMEAALEVSDTLVEQALEIAEPDVGTTGANADAGAATATVPPAPADDLNKAAGSSTAEINTADLKTVDNIATDNNTTVDDAPTDQQPTDQQPIDARDSDAESVADEHDPAEDLEGRDPTVLTAAAEDGPPALPGYSSMTLAQVRGHLRELSADDIGVLLRYEQDSDNRPPFLTLLSNRLVTLDSQNQ